MRREGPEFELISWLCLRSFPDKMKIGYELKIVPIVYVKCRCLPRITRLNEILLEIGSTVITLLAINRNLLVNWLSKNHTFS